MTFEQRKLIVNETNSTFCREEWYRGAACDPHPVTRELTLEFRVNYIPLLEKKHVIAFAQNKNLPYMFTIVDKNGNKAE